MIHVSALIKKLTTYHAVPWGGQQLRAGGRDLTNVPRKTTIEPVVHEGAAKNTGLALFLAMREGKGVPKRNMGADLGQDAPPGLFAPNFG